MSKYFYIVHEDHDDARIVTRCGREEFAQDFIGRMAEGNYKIHPSNEDKNHHALQEYIDNQIKGIAAIMPKLTGENKMSYNQEKITNGLLLISSGFNMLSQAFGVSVEVKVSSPELDKKSEEIKKEKKTKAKKEEPKQEEIEEVATQEDDFGDFDFDGSEEKKEITIEEVRAACVAHAKKNTKEKTYEVLKSFKAKSPNDLKKEDYAAVLAKLEV